MLVDNQSVIRNVNFVDESGALMVQYSFNENLKRNVVLAAFVTCHSRFYFMPSLKN